MDYFNWQPVENTVNERVEDGSILDAISSRKKIAKQTKFVNRKVKKYRGRLKTLKHFLKLKKKVRNTCEDGDETDAESVLSLEEFKRIHRQNANTRFQKFLKNCTEERKREPYPQQADEKSPSLDSKKFNGKTLTKFNNSQGKTSLFDFEKLKLQAQSRKSSTIASLGRRNTKETDIQEDDNVTERKSIHKVVKDLLCTDSEEESDFQKLKTAEIEDHVTIQDCSDGQADSETQYEVESEDSSTHKQDICNTRTDIEDRPNTSIPVSIPAEISNIDYLPSEDGIHATDDDRIDLEENFNNETDDNEITDNINHDSGNISLSDTDFLKDEHENSSLKKCLDLKSERPILSTKIPKLQKNGIRESLDNELKILQINLREEELTEDEVESDCSVISNASEEIKLANSTFVSQLERQFLTRSKLKITSNQRFTNGYEIFSKYQLSKKNKIEAVNESDEKFDENKLSSRDEEPSECKTFSEDCDLSQSKSQPLDPFVDREDSSSSFKMSHENAAHSLKNNLITVNEEQSKDRGNTSDESDSLEIPSPSRPRSLSSSFSSFCGRSYDEDSKNIIKSQLLLEIEDRLKDSPSAGKRRSSLNQSKKLKRSLQNEDSNSKSKGIDTLIDSESLTEDAELLHSKEADEECSSSKIEPQKLNRSVVIENSLVFPNSAPTKKRFSNNSLVDDAVVSRKQQRLHQQSPEKPIELNSCERKSPERISHELETIKYNEESFNEKNEEPNMPKNVRPTSKRKLRPRNLKEFVASEGLTLDTTKSHFRLKNISDDDEIWIMNVPKMIDPQDLQDKTILLGGKTELRIGDDCYKVSSKPSKTICSLSCIFTTSKSKNEYKIVNIESKGKIKFHPRIFHDSELDSTIVDQSPPSKISTVPFPKNLKMRHPLFGAIYEDKI